MAASMLLSGEREAYQDVLRRPDSLKDSHRREEISLLYPLDTGDSDETSLWRNKAIAAVLVLEVALPDSFSSAPFQPAAVSLSVLLVLLGWTGDVILVLLASGADGKLGDPSVSVMIGSGSTSIGKDGSSNSTSVDVVGMSVTICLRPVVEVNVAAVGRMDVVDVVVKTAAEGIKGSVARRSRSASRQRIWIAGPTVTGLPFAVSVRLKPQTPPRKSVVSEVQVNPLEDSRH
ncbi:hypothetical protein Daesc_001303 [Daldinia eschscholtzii]|uniref:Uncharacterized protein n=1 Tax=Daldinia eschscholtzii TaxID=292717 RepID=A0AAX6MUD2_9PEZI